MTIYSIISELSLILGTTPGIFLSLGGVIVIVGAIFLVAYGMRRKDA